MQQVAVFGGVGLAEADGAGAAQRVGVAMNQQLLVADLTQEPLVERSERMKWPFFHSIMA